MEAVLSFVETASLKKSLEVVSSHTDVTNFFWTNIDSDAALFSLLSNSHTEEEFCPTTSFDQKVIVAAKKELRLFHHFVHADLEVVNALVICHNDLNWSNKRICYCCKIY
jgi:hypothetical protein